MSFVFLFHYLRSADKSRDKMQKKTKKTRCYLSTHRKLKKEDSHIYISFLFLVLFYFIIVYLFLLLNLFFFLKFPLHSHHFPFGKRGQEKQNKTKIKIKPKILKQSTHTVEWIPLSPLFYYFFSIFLSYLLLSLSLYLGHRGRHDLAASTLFFLLVSLRTVILLLLAAFEVFSSSYKSEFSTKQKKITRFEFCSFPKPLNNKNET